MTGGDETNGADTGVGDAGVNAIGGNVPGDGTSADDETAPWVADETDDELAPDNLVLLCQGDKHWVGISVRYDDDVPAEDIRYRITLPNGQIRTGKTDARGRAVLRPISNAEGNTCTVALPGVDDACWCRRDAGRRGPMVEGRAEGTVHPVRDGDGVSLLAMRAGLLPGTVWQHPRNSELSKARKDGNVLLDGHDEIYVPALLETCTETIPIDQITPFRLPVLHHLLKLRLYDARGEPRGGLQYLLDVDGEATTGRTRAADGGIDVPVPVTARAATLKLKSNPEEVYELRITALDPPDTVRGAQQRLIALGYDCGEEYGAPGAMTDRAICAFQRDHGVIATGLLDGETLDGIEAEYRESDAQRRHPARE